MVSNVRPKRIFASFVVASAIAVYVPAPFAGGPSPKASAAQAASASRPSLDYELFKTRVEPIFLKQRSADHARCYTCHQVSHHGGGPLSLNLEQLSPGSNFWTEEQSRRNFEIVSKLGYSSDQLSRLFLLHSLVSEDRHAHVHRLE